MTTISTTVAVPEAGGGWREIELSEPRAWAEHPQPFESRIAFAAAHVVADPRGENVPGAPAVIDWEATLAFRRHLFRYGLGVAEAMDTAQRNMGLDWAATQELITRSSPSPASTGPGSPLVPELISFSLRPEALTRSPGPISSRWSSWRRPARR